MDKNLYERLKTAIPEDIWELAYQSKGYQLAWKRGDLPGAIPRIAAEGLAITGGELWMLAWEGTYTSALETSPEEATNVIWSIDAHWDEGSEGWTQFCERAAKENLQAIRKLEKGDSTFFKNISDIRYHFDIVDKTYYCDADL
jgi:hypothetical protein